jgi:hypothetical protein
VRALEQPGMTGSFDVYVNERVAPDLRHVRRQARATSPSRWVSREC